MIKTFFKLTLVTVVYTILFVVANALFPFSQGFKELGSAGDPLSLLFILISSAWSCFAMYFIIRNAKLSGIKLSVRLFGVFFFVQYFMTQIETLFFGSAFSVLTKIDTVLIMLVGIVPLLGAVPLSVKFFQNKNGTYSPNTKVAIKDMLVRLGGIGILYLCVYMLFGYFVAWQFEELRLFYTGSSEMLSFWGQMANNVKTNTIIIPFQILRGILFGIAIIPIKNMVDKSKLSFVISVCLLYLCTAIVLIIPNVLFPDQVRIAHLIEMSSSMLLFGVIAGMILWGSNRGKKLAFKM